MQCKITVKDEVWCVITGLTPNHVDRLYKELGVHPEGYFFMPSFKYGGWDGYVRFFEKTGKTYVRLLPAIIPFLEAWGYDIDLVDNRKFWRSPDISKLKVTAVDADGIAVEAEGCDILGDVEIAPGVPFRLRPYQVQAIIAMIEAGSGFAELGTGAGKTSVTGVTTWLYGTLGYRVLTIVPSSDLVTQTWEWYQKLGIEAGRYSGAHKEVECQHVVATWQSLQNNLGFLSQFQVIIWDEAHGATAAVAQKILNEAGKHVAFRFGVTGTMPKPDADQLTLTSCVGDVLIRIPCSWLIKNGYLAFPEIQEIELDETYIDENFPDYASEKAFLGKSVPRIEAIANLIISEAMQRGNTMVLVNNIAFGKKLAALIKGAVFLWGETANDIRKEHYEMFATHHDLIVIANAQIASTGISIDRIFNFMVIDAGKSFVKAIQSIGRALRKSHDKDRVHISDVHSKLKFALKHWKERRKYYQEAEYTVLPKLVLRVKKN